jgi:hypothetical protein
MSYKVLIVKFLHVRNTVFSKCFKNEKIHFSDENKRDNFGPWINKQCAKIYLKGKRLERNPIWY